jgi:dTDP-L-rhamnose 4-epimerase
MLKKSAVCIVTGGAGFIGKHLVDSVAANFEVVIVVDSLIAQVHGSDPQFPKFASNVVFVKRDICDKDTWDLILSTYNPTVVYHLAAETGTGQSLSSPDIHAMTNVVGLSVMLEAFTKYSKIPSRIVLSSTRAVYGEGRWMSTEMDASEYPAQRSKKMLSSGRWDYPASTNLPMSSDHNECKPISVYGVTKLAQEQILRIWSISNQVECVILRLQNVYGEGQSLINSYTGILSLFCKIAKNGGQIPLYEDGKMIRDFIYVTDVVSALVASLGIELSKGEDLVLDIGTGIPLTIEDVALKISHTYGAPAPKITGQFRIGDVRHAFCDNSKATQILDWSPQVEITKGIESLVKWIEES